MGFRKKSSPSDQNKRMKTFHNDQDSDDDSIHQDSELPDVNLLEDENQDSTQDQDFSQEEEDDDEEQFQGGNAQGAGTIESVDLTNFMCHSRLEMKFGKNINFVSGRNGSGKSAVLTALTVALGGKASFTQRAGSLSKLLKEGQEMGEIHVKIRNSGQEAFRHEEYGDTIQVIRTLSAHGSGSLKLKSKSGKTISSRREDLTKMTDHFQIEVENPMAILTQDTARSFLVSSTPKSMYTFFQKGTMLDKLKVAIDRLEMHANEIKESLKRKEELLPEMREEYRAMELKWNEMEAAKHLEKQLMLLNNEQVWSKVFELENKIYDQEEDVEQCTKKVNQSKEKFKEQEAALNQIDEKRNELKERQEAMKQSTIPIKKDMDAAKEELSQYSRKINELKGQISEIKDTLEERKRNIVSYEKAAEEETKKQSIDIKTQREEADRRIQVIDEKIEQRQMDSNRSSTDKDAAQSRIEAITHEIDQTKNLGNRLGDELKNLDSNRSRMISQRKNHLAVFGQGVPQVVQEIERLENERKWRGKKPIGPFGAHMKLKDRKFRSAVESHLKHLIPGFAVDCHDDQQLLQQVLDRFRCKSVVYKYRDQGTFDFSSGIPDRSLVTINDILDVTHPIVLQMLVIHGKIESVVLVENDRQGDQVIANGYPQKVSRIFTADCYEIGSRTGALSAVAINRYNGPPLLSTDVEQDIKELENTINAKQAEFNQVKNRHMQMKDEMAQLQRDFQTFQRLRNNAERDIATYQSQVAEIRASLVSQDESILSVIMEKLEADQESVIVLQRQIDDLEDQLGVQSESYNNIGKDINEKRAELAKIKQATDAIVKELGSYDTSRLNNEIQYWRKKIDEHTLKRNLANEKMVREKEMLDEMITLCESRCPRPEGEPRDEEDIRADVRKITAKLKEKEREFGSREIFHNKMMKKQKELKEAEEQVQDFGSITAELENARQKRSVKFQIFQKSITNRAKMAFTKLLQMRGYRGTIEIDHDSKTLVLHVDVSGNNEEDQENDTMAEKDARSLSGGEKSYSTICLLLALWDSMFTPFRCLDEFDVFMDAVNRRLAVKLLVEYARDTKNGTTSQFILISPQNTSHLKELEGPDIKIFNMHPPERGQTTLNFNANP